MKFTVSYFDSRSFNAPIDKNSQVGQRRVETPNHDEARVCLLKKGETLSIQTQEGMER